MKIKPIIIAVFFSIIFSFSAVYCLNPKRIYGETLTINQALSYSLKFNKMIKISAIKLASASYGENEAMSGFFPRINFHEIYINTDNPLYAFGSILNERKLSNSNVNYYFSPSFLDNPGMIHNYESAFEIEQPLFMGGKVYYGYKRAILHRKALKMVLSESKQKVLYSVAKAYYSAELAKKYVKLMKNMVKTAGEYKTIAQNLFRAGQVVSSDVLRARVNLASMKEKLASAEENYKLARYFLNINMGVDVDSKYELTSELKTAPYNKSLSIAGLQREAMNNRPDYKEVELNKKNMKLGIMQAYGKFLPNLVAGYDYFSNGPAIHPDDAYSYAFSIMLNFNIFSGLYDYNNLEKSKSDYNTMIEYEGLIKNKIEMQVRKAYLQYRTDLTNTKVASLAALNAKDTLRITQNRYKAGVTTLINLNQTLDQYKAARINYLDSLYKLNLDYYYIKLVTGKMIFKKEGQ